MLDEKGAKENLRCRFPEDRKPYTNRYDYGDDSDLEEDDDDDIPDDEPAGDPQVVTKEPRNNSDIIVLEKSNAKINDPSGIVSVSDLDSLFSESSDTKGRLETSSSARIGKVAVIEDVAFVTYVGLPSPYACIKITFNGFQAMLRYLYTEEIEFAPWDSAERREARALEKISESYGIPKPSPKSVYRLADKVTSSYVTYQLGITLHLVRHTRIKRARVAEDPARSIQVQHHRGSVQQVHLLVSYPPSFKPVRFPWIDRYPELRELELRQLARVLLSSDPDYTLGLLQAKIRSYGRRELPHAEDILPALYEITENDESVKETPFPAPAPSSQQTTGGDWEGLKKALTSSLTSGSFLDSQFYAVESKSSGGLPKVRPVYFCNSFVSKLVACKSLTLIICEWVVDSSFQIRRNSEHGEYYLPEVQMGMIAILMTKILIQRVPRSVTLVQSCS